MPRLTTVPGRYAVCRLPAGAAAPAITDSASFLSITATADEVSIVCEERSVPGGARSEPGWSLLRVDGPIPFSAVGIVAALTAPIAAAGIGVFVISTFDTDYLLVKTADLDTAADALQRAGHPVDRSGAAA